MPGKHSRMLRSSSQGEIGFFNHVRRFDAPTPLWEKRRAPAVVSKPVQNPVKMSNPSSAKPEQTRPRILTLGSPVKDSCWDIYENKGEGFLEACCYCKKKIGEKDEVLMYGYLSAFCSTECHHKQIALDKEVDKPLDPTEEATLRRWEKNLKNLFGAGAKTDAPS